jgi:uncharacterized protein YciI
MPRTRFVVVHRPGPGWDHDRGMREQDGWDEHARFMDDLIAEGFIVLGGPLEGGEHRAMLVIDAPDEEAVRERLDADPWKPHMLEIESVRRWTVLLEGG